MHIVTSEDVFKSGITWPKTCDQYIQRIGNLLEAQREELMDIRLYAEGKRLPTLREIV
jgi:hypothetical protein